MKNNLLLYVHFNKENKMSDHVRYQLDKVRSLFGEVFFISNSVLSESDLAFLQGERLIDGFMQRENKGYDFVAWSDAMKAYGFDKLASYDSVTIMNDTCFGPIFDFEPTLERFSADDEIDFWGITNNRAHSVGPEGLYDGKKHLLPDHIQSYFVNYKQKVVQSEAFQNFWSNIEVLDNVVEVIVRYETAMTKYFEDAGFKSAVMFDTRKEKWDGMLVHDFSVFNLSELIKRRIPFLKIKAFSYGAEAVYTPVNFEELKRLSAYPLDLIVKHMTWMDYPDRPYMLNEKRVKIDDEQKNSDKSPRVGIHLHVFYVDLLQEFLDNFDRYIGEYALFITTDTDNKKAEIEQITAGKSAVQAIIVTGNVGRDVIPWMMIHEKLSGYDIAGHFHTKKSADNYWVVGESWRQDLVENLIEPAQKLFSELEKTELGLIVSDVPSFFQNFRGPVYMDEEAIWNKMKAVWDRIDFAQEKELKQKDSYTMSYGTMVWYKPAALDNLLSLDIKGEVPKEPLPYDSVLHAFERLLVYTAWGNGYDFRISQRHSNNGFLANVSMNRTLRELKGDNRDYRARELATMLYQKIKFMVKYNLLKMIGKR